MQPRTIFALAAGACGVLAVPTLAPPAAAHEFWLDAVQYTPKIGARVPIVHRNGQNFLGDSFPYLRAQTRRYSVIDARGERPVKAIEGDDPASEITFAQQGLAVVTFLGAPETLKFETIEKFESYLQDEGLEPIGKRHREAGKPLAGIREVYSRAAKALIQVGASGGNDRATGLPLEIIAEQNPYTLEPGAALPVRVLYNGKAIEGILVKSFNRDDPLSPRRARTDTQGRTHIDLPKSGEYLLGAVHMMPAAPRDKADWVSIWASTTFKRP